MKLLLLILALSSLSNFAFAQEKTTPPPKVYPVALPNYDEEAATRLQIFLDNNYFAPGKIDGKMGEFFRKALISYKHARAMPKTGAVDQWMLDQVPVTYTTYTIGEEDLKLVGDVPSGRAEQAARIRRRAFSLRRIVHSETQPGKELGASATGRSPQGAERLAIRGRKIRRGQSS